MKDFDYYATIDVPYPDRAAHRKQLEEALSQTPMTAFQRTNAMKEIRAKNTEWFCEAIKPYNARQEQLTQEFWADCREDFGYDDFLDDDGAQALEAYAWQQGHANGFAEVHCILYDLVALAKKIAKNVKGAPC